MRYAGLVRAAAAGVDHVWEGIREHNIERRIDSGNAGRILPWHDF
ncbi:MAG: hypothetical protein E6230_27650 [Paenibacillus dendritiformis]|nr:hypothetical protein [Paenibacillus dendritiformis]MDU5145947.1 hypothetical protein [Paenibacillus dendritiformis]